MAVPFHRLTVCGSILLAARGASIHTFNIADGSHIAAWQAPQPAADKAEADKDKLGDKADDQVAQAGEAAAGNEAPPSKRRRVDEPGPAQNGSQKTKSKKPAAAAAQAAAAHKTAALRTADLPVVSILEATADGRHAVVLLGHDKTLRVLAHDGQGHLAQRSARVMPKRPCAVALTADGATILAGDKFGDVYALPLVPVAKTEAEKKEEEEEKEEARRRQAAEHEAAVIAAGVAPLRLAANQFTVHTKGNRQALENQRRQKELLLQQGAGAGAGAGQTKKEDAEGAYQLLLGHVSMLTAVAVAEGFRAGEWPADKDQAPAKQRRPLILTADRDEHIRVTRGVVGRTPATSQTHVIETFCLGHTSFVSRLCVLAGRPDRLVSGGGDGELRVWNFWPAGRLVGTADLASLVAGVSGAAATDGAPAPKVAVSGLYSFGAAGDDAAGADLVAICERVPALFFFALAADGATLAPTQTLRLPHGQLPLDVAAVGHQLVVATVTAEDAAGDAPAAPTSLLRLARAEAGWSVAAAPFASLAPATPDDDAATAALDRGVLRQLLLHSNESLRKDKESEE